MQGGFPPQFTTAGASSPEDDNSASASPESSTDAAPPANQNKPSSRRTSGNHDLAVGAGSAAYHDKRKNDQRAGAIKDRRASDGADGKHSHEMDDGGATSEDTAAKGGPSGNKGKNSERRKAQNRQAQRNFRERKEKVRLPRSPGLRSLA